MKKVQYRISQLPNTQYALNYKVKSGKDKETVFSIARSIISLWGNPDRLKLKEFMIAHIKKNGWAKETVSVSETKYMKNLNHQIASLHGKGK